jgi:hypothetical protein
MLGNHDALVRETMNKTAQAKYSFEVIRFLAHYIIFLNSINVKITPSAGDVIGYYANQLTLLPEEVVR